MNLSDLFPDEDFRFRMALERSSPAEFFRPTAPGIIAERQRWLQSEPHLYSALLPGGESLLEECLALAGEWRALPPEQQERLASIPTPPELCARLGEILEPDFLLLQADAARRFQLLGGCVCFPSSWSLSEKLGQGLEFIHGPVPGLNAALGRNIDSFLARLTPGTAWLRHNWGLSRSPELNQHPSRDLPRLDASVKLAEAWLRVEHQALVALPRSGGILFGIRVTVHSLAEVEQDRVTAGRLARALHTMPEEVAAYKGLAAARARLVALLERPL